MTHILAIDQGTTSSRAILFDGAMQMVAVAQREFTQHFPASGWVEHDAGEIWESVVTVCQEVMNKTGLSASEIAGIGITNQRETTLIWDADGTPVGPAIVWQDRRTSEMCTALKAHGHEAMVTAKTGLLLDPYFSATKVKWLLDHHDLRGRTGLKFGTMDSWLIYKMTGRHVTDATNAARTMLYDIHNGAWSAEMCALLDIPMEILPEVHDCASDFRVMWVLGGAMPMLGVAAWWAVATPKSGIVPANTAGAAKC